MDVNKLAKKVTEEATAMKNPHTQALGRLGGLKGGIARREKLSPERRKEISQKAITARWPKKILDK